MRFSILQVDSNLLA